MFFPTLSDWSMSFTNPILVSLSPCDIMLSWFVHLVFAVGFGFALGPCFCRQLFYCPPSVLWIQLYINKAFLLCLPEYLKVHVHRIHRFQNSPSLSIWVGKLCNAGAWCVKRRALGCPSPICIKLKRGYFMQCRGIRDDTTPLEMHGLFLA